MKFGRIVLNKRFENKLLQYELAKYLSVDPSVICRIESGKREATPEVAASLVRYFNDSKLADAYCEECPVAKARKETKLRLLKAA